MKNFVSIVVLMGLVIVQGSSLFEQVIKNVNRNDNEGNKAQKVSRNILKLTDDTSDLQIKDNRNALSPFLFWLFHPVVSSDAMLQTIKDKGMIKVDTAGKVSHVLNSIGNIVDITVTIVQIPFSTDVLGDVQRITPEILSVQKDLQGIVNCHDYTCSINVLGLNITAGYTPVPMGVFLSIEFMEFSIVNEKISTTGFRYCEPIELPIRKAKICIQVSGVELSNERACLNLGFSFIGFSHTFPDLCIFGSRKTTS